ncbi:aminotransferase class I/II-fold pyridoxal phosphate-dependent enzyme [Variovorax sp. J22G21]|uniref:aminotransferase class I/II-fold pyridoxal phosphate-dependent enzyme n=1 Tax=Variovorax fucosicus TaxID=3053517 RepID=UPI002578D0FF|nr:MULTISPECIES: aminotransferase class I/II-fold pyridoxal phosphate-dependent enzyme [unclassified Variovorax]MDM0037595.1 aminotransferase class I/II-fold pyridoxal phosphate-dependent enzyme [Variovorax sp. J22R193]MDM0056735.1 aminotransferase class I/II-fold pyridoxal phosphate-dependent enzyme [Variovorax sp. J22G47]MDM0062371.1 aminotransferase class I/II-fold pyridoxal phosphate-dependent enzyme [Variovorax sp. J22G21]
MPTPPSAAFALSRRAQRVKLSANAAASGRAAALAAQGRDVLTLTSGEPDFDTPEPIKQAAVAALARGETKYTATPGTLRLRQAISAKYRRENALDYTVSQIVVANGAKQVIFEALAATVDAGDEVIVPAPYWPSFPDIVRVNDGTPVIVASDEASGFKLTPQALEAVITPRTRWLILNSPSNPTGAVYTADELAALAEVLRRHPRVQVLWDEIYEHIWFGAAPPAHLLHVAPDLRERTLLVNGASKTYAMTGWRIGWGAGPEALVRAMVVIQSQVSSGPNAIGQAATEAALQSPDQRFVSEARTAYARRAAFVSTALNAVPGISVLAPEGAFFVYVNCGALIGRVRPDGRPIASDTEVVDWLLEAEGVAAVDGPSYGLSPYFRLSIAASDAVLADAVGRIARAVDALRPGDSVALAPTALEAAG